MSRSKKKNPSISWACYFSNKKCKQRANRFLRRKNKEILRNNPEDEDSIFKILREVSDVWDFSSDGLTYYVGWNYRRSNNLTIKENVKQKDFKEYQQFLCK